MHKPINPKLAKYSDADIQRIQREIAHLRQQPKTAMMEALIKTLEIKIGRQLMVAI